MLLPLLPPPPQEERSGRWPAINLHALPSPRPLPKRKVPVHLPPGVVPMTTLHRHHTPPEIAVDVDDCHTMSLIAQSFNDTIKGIRASFQRMDATTTIFRQEMEEAEEMAELIRIRCAWAKVLYAELVHNSAIRIQRLLRGYWGRRKTASTIQRMYRKRLTRRKAHLAVFKATMANTVLGLRTFNKYIRAHPDMDPTIVFEKIRASIRVQRRWRAAYQKVRSRYAEMAEQVRRERLCTRFFQLCRNIATVISILKFWRRATIFHYFTMPEYKKTRNGILSSFKHWRRAATSQNRRRSALSHREGDVFVRAAKALHATPAYGKEPKAWYARHTIRTMDDKELSSVPYTPLVCSPGNNTNDIDKPKVNIDLNLTSPPRSLSLPGTVSLGPWEGPTESDNKGIPLVVTSAIKSGVTIPTEFLLSTPRVRKPKELVPKHVAKKNQLEFVQKLKQVNERRRQAVDQAKAKRIQDEKDAEDVKRAKAEELNRKRLERMKELEDNLERRRLQRLRDQQQKRTEQVYT
ncbi:hypothetical protein THRCLA_07716 [Thraustotheca clavata]|uniref:Uncharacterized protein n=1 Tax=Thraustotheca clavata TaxID=74557 RepID=A0A1V9ZC88_9STRA|nr:hypothetical protein THRCLA_07716 [Thraustotheca clavata]